MNMGKGEIIFSVPAPPEPGASIETESQTIQIGNPQTAVIFYVFLNRLGSCSMVTRMTPSAAEAAGERHSSHTDRS